MKNSLVISEKFTSIQGEGQTIGKKAIFLRLAGCNILCKSHDWVCDTIEVWQKGTKTNFEDIFTQEEIVKLQNEYHLIITGGEPLLYQDTIVNFVDWLQEERGVLPIIEVETNGTIFPSKEMQKIVNYWNVSPKLKSSGADLKRFNLLALKEFSNNKNTIFKFVVSSLEDIKEINSDFCFLDWFKIYLMPAGDSQEKLDKIRKQVVEWCLKYNFNYSDRLHIVIWNQKTGV